MFTLFALTLNAQYKLDSIPLDTTPMATTTFYAEAELDEETSEIKVEFFLDNDLPTDMLVHGVNKLTGEKRYVTVAGRSVIDSSFVFNGAKGTNNILIYLHYDNSIVLQNSFFFEVKKNADGIKVQFCYCSGLNAFLIEPEYGQPVLIYDTQGNQFAPQEKIGPYLWFLTQQEGIYIFKNPVSGFSEKMRYVKF